MQAISQVLKNFSRRHVENGFAHVAADVVHENLDGAVLALDFVDERHHLFLAARVAAEGHGAAACLLDRGLEIG